jgi:hypothetical protein
MMPSKGCVALPVPAAQALAGVCNPRLQAPCRAQPPSLFARSVLLASVLSKHPPPTLIAR